MHVVFNIDHIRHLLNEPKMLLFIKSVDEIKFNFF